MNVEQKFREMFNVCIEWVNLKQKNKRIDTYLKSKGHQKIVVYGMGDIGNRLCYELLQENVFEMIYAVDQGLPKLFYDIPCYKLADAPQKDEINLVIVTLPYEFENIKKTIERYFRCEIISIRELIYNVSYYG